MSFTEGSKINTDNMPVIEYSAPKHIWNRNENAVANFMSMIKLRKKITPLMPGADKDEAMSGIIDRYFKARGKILRGKVENSKRNYNKELQYYQEAASLGSGDPYLAMAVFDLGYIYFGRRDYNTSSKLFEWTKRLNSELIEAHFYLVKSYEHLNQPEKANEAFLDLAEIRPDLAENLISK
jgi:tetratricopeptide (TPR) repeat protein